MKKIRSVTLCLLLFALSFTLFGCSDSPAPAEGGEEKTLFGTVLSFEEGALSLRTARGDFTLPVPESAEGRELLTKDAEVQLFYRGELEQPEEVTVLRIKSSGGGETGQTSDDNPSDESQQRTYTGKVVAVSGSSVAIEVSGDTLTFFTSGADLSGVRGGIAEGDTIELVCAGQMVQSVKTITKADGSAPSETPPSNPSENGGQPETPSDGPTRTVTGTAIDRSLHNLIIETDGGEMLAFTITGLTLPEADYESGKVKVTVSYTGSIEGTDTTKVKVTAVALA